MRLQVEGWRALPQSFAVVNQFQCLEILTRDGVELSHLDAPFPPARMLAVKHQWRHVGSLFSPEATAALAAIRAPDPDVPPDATLRLFFPADFSAAVTGRTLVFCVTETGPLQSYMIAAGQSLDQSLLNNEVTIITPSAWSKRGLVSGGVPAERVHIVAHGVDPAIYYPRPQTERRKLRRALGWEGGFIFLNTSNLYSWKGISLLLKAFAVIAERYPRVRLMLKGIDNIYASRKSLQFLIRDLTTRERATIEPRLNYTGATYSFADLACLYQGADALVAPYHAEGFNLPVLEAMACGLPVICTAGGPTDEFAGEGLTLPVHSRETAMKEANRYQLLPNLEHLIELMSGIIEDSALREHIYTHAPAHVHGNYTWRHTVDRLFEVVGDVPDP